MGFDSLTTAETWVLVLIVLGIAALLAIRRGMGRLDARHRIVCVVVAGGKVVNEKAARRRLLHSSG